MRRATWLRALALGVIVSLTATSALLGSIANAQTAVSSPSEAPLIPLRRFIANTDVAGDYRLSPNGEKLMWIEAVGLSAGIGVREVGSLAPVAGAAPDADRTLTSPIRRFAIGRPGTTWLADSRHILLTRDSDGSENTQLAVLDTDSADAKPRLLTPWPGSKSNLVSIDHAKAGWFYFQTNQRDKKTFDLYETEIASGAVQPVETSDGTVLQWLIDSGDGKLGARVRSLEGGRMRILEVVTNAETKLTWSAIHQWDGQDFYGGVHRINRSAGFAVLSGTQGRDTAGLWRFSLTDQKLTQIHADPRVDFSFAHYALRSAAPYAVRYEPDYSETAILDEALRKDVTNALTQRFGARLKGLRIAFLDASQRRLLLYPQLEAGTQELLFDRASQSFTVLRDASLEPETTHLANMRPISFTARDGRRLFGYLTQPNHLEGKVAPLIAVIHGGPWVRNTWSSKSTTGEDALWAQILANRGYGVLQINYRGSLGYGRAHLDAAVRELGGKTQDDIEDGVNWAIAQGLADPKRIGVAGRSFGGYSTLMQMVRAPEKYACGVSIVGVANWVRQIEAQPPYWVNFRHTYDRFYGDPAKPEDRARLMAQSPITHLDKIRAPLLLIHGANDVRVLKADSEDVAAALTAQGKPVESLIFPDEGHSISKWQNRLKMYRRMEEFFAKCLGGRDGGFDLFQLAGD